MAYSLKPQYHFSPMIGWLNDPNGLIEFKEHYHLFYQFNPHGPIWGKMHWGHAVSKDLFHWIHLPVALYPEKAFSEKDFSGIFSGSAIEKDGQLFLMYTQYFDPEIFTKRFKEEQCIAFSEDGVNFKKYPKNPVIAKPPNQLFHDYRDPKIFKKSDDHHYYCVIGAGENGVGEVLLYTSEDLYKWHFEKILCKFDPVRFGPVIECPDFFQLNGKWVLLFSAGFNIMETRKNYYAIGDFIDNKFLPNSIEPMDLTNDLYATQTFQDKNYRRIAIGWLYTPDRQNYSVDEGWAGIMSLPKELTIKDNRLIQRPVKEIKTLIQEKNSTFNEQNFDKTVDISSLENLLYISLINESEDFQVVFLNGEDKVILDKTIDSFEITELRNGIINFKVTYELKNILKKLEIYMDKTSFELFFNEGEQVASHRIYPRDNYRKLIIQPFHEKKISIFKVQPTFNRLL